MTEKEEYYVASLSGGKDSTAMVLMLIDKGYQLDEVICCDTGMEFPQMYEHIAKVKNVVEQNGIRFTTLKSEKTFDYYMFECEPKRKNPRYEGKKGYGWADFRNRWCTSNLKTNVINRHLKKFKATHNVIQYVGIASDEQHRLRRQYANAKNIRFPLNEWGVTEQQALAYCYQHGYNWGGLYEIFSRVSCWCCPLQPIGELRKLYKHFPKLWEKLKEMEYENLGEDKLRRTIKTDYSVFDLEKRFSFEEQRTAEGKAIKGKEFFIELRKELGR